MTTTVNTTATIAASLTTLTVAELTSELARVSRQYRGEQVAHLSKSECNRWEKHMELIEAEIERRG